MEQRSGRIVRTGFALPTVLIASVVMLAVLSASVAAATSTRAALLNQRYDSLATYAAESGMQMAKECMAAGFTTWSEPLRPGGTCAGLASACSDPSCYLVNEPNVRSSFEVSPPTTDGDISTVRSQGIVEQLRTTGSGVIRSYSSAMKQVIVDTGGGGEPIYATVENYAGSGLSGSTNGAAASARFNRPYGVTIDSAGNVYISEISNHAIRKITTDGTVSTFAGEVGDPDDDDGFGTSAAFDTPYGLAIDSSDNIYVADTGNHTIRKITPSRYVSTFAGDAGDPGSKNGVGNNAAFNGPRGVAVDSAGNIYVADRGNHRIRKITPSRSVSTFAGSSSGYVNATGTSARFSSPSGVAVDSQDNVYVADTGNNRIRKITPSGVVTTFAGSSAGYLDATGESARFTSPFGIAIDQFDTAYVTDNPSSGPRIRAITQDGVVTTLAGSGTSGYLNGLLLDARFNNFGGLAVGVDGNIFIADNGNQRIRIIAPASYGSGTEPTRYYF